MPLKLHHPHADVFVPDSMDPKTALARITHLCIAAHQDDIEILAYHGIAECFGREDKWFGGVVATNGSGSPRAGIYGRYSDEDMQTVRRHEQRKAAYIGEYGIQVQLAYSSSEVKDGTHTRVREDLQGLIDAAQPEVLYLHNPADKHDTHIAVLVRSLEAVRSLPKERRPKKAYGCEVWRDLDWLDDGEKVMLPASKYDNIAAALIGVFDSQISGGKRYDLATAGRRLANATYADPRTIDTFEAVTAAIDLTPFIEDDTLSLETHTLEYIERFKNDVRQRIGRFTSFN